MAVNHSGDSDSTGSLAGNLLGVQYGMETVPDDWLSGLEMKDMITEVPSDLADTFADNRFGDHGGTHAWSTRNT